MIGWGVGVGKPFGELHYHPAPRVFMFAALTGPDLVRCRAEVGDLPDACTCGRAYAPSATRSDYESGFVG